MSLFDGAPISPKQRKKASSRSSAVKIVKRKPKYGNDKPVEAKTGRDERRRFTEAYERGEIKIEDTSDRFLLCHCCVSPDYHSFPHEPHVDELAKFELEHYGRRKNG